MPGPVSDSYDPEFGTAAVAGEVREAMAKMHESLGEIIGGLPEPILEVVRRGHRGGITATLDERSWRILRFACEYAKDCI